MFLALWGLRSVIWLSSRNESADQPVPGVDIVLRPCQVPANLLKNLDQKNMFFRLTPFAYDPFWGHAMKQDRRGMLRERPNLVSSMLKIAILRGGHRVPPYSNQIASVYWISGRLKIRYIAWWDLEMVPMG